MPEVTIIIPVYNTPQSLLEANIKSVLSQYGDIEIVYINDGSTDTWVDLMLTEAANSDSRVTYIKKQNTGVSSTRNEGIKRAHGKYIMFVDADDILLEDAITNCLISAKAENADVVLFGMSNFPKSTRVKKMLSPVEKEKLLLATLSYLSAEYVKIGISIDGPCAKLFRASIIEEYDIFFPENIARAEDAIFDAYCYEYADKVFVDNFDVYTFISNPASLTRSYKYQLVQMIPIYLKEEKKFIETFHPNSLLYAKSLQYRTFMGVMEVVYSYFEPNPERKSVKRLRKEFTDLMRNEFVHDNLQGITKTDLQKMGFQSLTDFLYLKSFLKPSYLLFKLSLLLMRFLEAIFSTKVYRELRRV